MKTVWDAVNNFRAKFPYHEYLNNGEECLVLADIGDVSMESGATGFCDLTYYKVCNGKEFDQCIAEMETNFGKYTGPKYDASKATKLEAESKVDYTSEEFCTNIVKLVPEVSDES